MPSSKTLRNILSSVAIGLAMAFIPGGAWSKDLSQPAGRADRPIGQSSAPVTIIEYSSPTCPHCVDYRIHSAAEIEKEFLGTGKVRFIFRPFVRNNVDMVIFMLCEGQQGAKYEALKNLFYSKYDDIAHSADLEATIRDIAASAGIDKPTFDRLVSDQAVLVGLNKLKTQALDEFQIEGTPTFFVNGKKVTGEQSIEEMRANIEEALKSH